MKDKNILKNKLKARRVIRVRSKIFGAAECPRLAVFKSLKYLSVQAIDDTLGKTLASVQDKEIKSKDSKIKAKEIGKLLAKKLLEKKINRAVFDKRCYKYHGIVKEVADGVREGGIKM